MSSEVKIDTTGGGVQFGVAPTPDDKKVYGNWSVWINSRGRKLENPALEFIRNNPIHAQFARALPAFRLSKSIGDTLQKENVDATCIKNSAAAEALKIEMRTQRQKKNVL